MRTKALLNLIKDKRCMIKLWNIFFKNNAKQFCDAYLSEIDGQWTIMLDGNGDKILMSKAQIEYLISKMEKVDLLRELKSELEYDFGLTNGEGIKIDDQFYKLLFKYQSHYKGDKKRYPLTLFIKNFKNRYSVNFNKMLLDLYKFKEILNNVTDVKGTIKIEHIYDIDAGERIYERSSYNKKNNNGSNSNNSNRNSNNNTSNNNPNSDSKDSNQSNEDNSSNQFGNGSNNSSNGDSKDKNSISDRDQKIIELGEVKVTVGKNKGKRLKELSKRDIEWLATKSFDKNLKKKATEFLSMMI